MEFPSLYYSQGKLISDTSGWIRSINVEGREQDNRFVVEQFEMRTFSRDRHFLENLPSLIHSRLDYNHK